MKFGPSGNSDSFFAEGHNATLETPKWVKERGLDIFEYSFGRGVNIKRETAALIGAEAEKCNIEFSVHSPYYINFASDVLETREKSVMYMLQSIEALKQFKGKRVVVHPGSPMKQSREAAAVNMKIGFELLAQAVSERGDTDIIICPETMGKINQMGTLGEILELCKIADFYVPCIDFGHLNSRNQGYLKSSDDYRQIFDEIYNTLGEEKGSKIHIHFSHIEYGGSGEIRHLTFIEDTYGPFFEHLAPVLVEYHVNGWLLSESNGMQAEEAVAMKELYLSALDVK